MNATCLPTGNILTLLKSKEKKIIQKRLDLPTRIRQKKPIMRKPFDPWFTAPKHPINSFDIDGVIYMGEYDGIYPGPRDIIVTGRSIHTRRETTKMLKAKGIDNPLFMNPKPKDFNDRKQSGQSKAKWFQHLQWLGYKINIHFDDDPIQIGEIKKQCPHIECVHVYHHLVPKE